MVDAVGRGTLDGAEVSPMEGLFTRSRWTQKLHCTTEKLCRDICSMLNIDTQENDRIDDKYSTKVLTLAVTALHADFKAKFSMKGYWLC